MFFGHQSILHSQAWVTVSDPEKTIIDIIYFNYPFAGEILPALLKIADKGKLAGYLKKIKGVRGSIKIGKRVGSWLAGEEKK